MRAETTLYVIQTYIAIGKLNLLERVVHCLHKLFTLGMSYLSPGLMGMSLHYRAPVTTTYLTNQSVLLSHQLVKVHVTVQLPKRLDLKP